MENVLVTGGSGFIASWIIKFLLEDGNTVHTTVRNLKNSNKIDHLLQMEKKFPNKLHLFEADLMTNGSFETAAKGCTSVIHCASPFVIGKIKDAYKELIDPAVKGTENVLKTVNNIQTIKRVVLTSSVVSVWGDASDINSTKNQEFDESYWNESSRISDQPYYVSKVMAEKKAWEVCKKQDRWQMVTINPGFVLGPSIQAKPSGTSQSFIEDFINGKNKAGVPELYFGCVDVRDVAKAHVKALNLQIAEGRFIISNEVMSMLDIAKLIEQEYPQKFKLPQKEVPKFLLYLSGPFLGFSWKYIRNNIGIPFKINNSRSQNILNLKYSNLSTTLRDQVRILSSSN